MINVHGSACVPTPLIQILKCTLQAVGENDCFVCLHVCISKAKVQCE